MKNNLIIFSVFTLLVMFSSQTFSRGSPRPKPPTSKPPVSSIAKGVHFEPVRNYTAEEKAVLVVAEKLANDLLQSSCFEKFMVNRALIETEGKSNIEVVNLLKNTNLTIPVEMYSKWWSNVIGYRQPPKPDIYTNRKYHAGSTACARSSNLTHEWSHTVGFSHSFESTPKRPFSVPYSINAAFSECCFCEKNSITSCSIK